MLATLNRSDRIEIDGRAYARGLSCVHCGLCLPACPTYVQTANEADSPRGRIQLMLGLADGKIELTESVKHHLDLCLDCRGCETACPSGVVYHELIEETRHRLSQRAGPRGTSALIRWFFLNILTHPTRLKLAMLPARILQKLGIYSLLRKIGFFRLLPVQLQKMEQMLPSTGRVWPSRLPERTGSTAGSARSTVAFFEGCIGSVIFDKVNQQTVELLSACGVNIVVPRAQTCCGAIHHHNGDHLGAVERAKQNIDAFANVPMIVTNVAGCGAMLREYDLLLRDDPEYAERARAFAGRLRDISEALLELGLNNFMHPVNQTVTYHDACHLAHAQKVTVAPRELLAKVPGLKLVALPESDMCCGAAGTYNLEHPDMARQLATRKLENIRATQAGICVTGNVGCAMHIQSQADARGQTLHIVHPVELLHSSVFGSSPPSISSRALL